MKNCTRHGNLAYYSNLFLCGIVITITKIKVHVATRYTTHDILPLYWYFRIKGVLTVKFLYSINLVTPNVNFLQYDYRSKPHFKGRDKNY